MTILHIIPNEKFTVPFISFINNNFDQEEHFFIIEKYNYNSKVSVNNNNVTLVEAYDYWELLYNAWRADKIILHSLTSPKVKIILFLLPRLAKKSYWVIWGSDLYYYNQRKLNFRSNFNEFIRRRIIKNLKGFITHIKGDYELAKKWYGAKGQYYYSFMYPSNLYKKYSFINVGKLNEKLFIQVGNSGDPSNNHIEVFDKLKVHKNLDIEIICPLSYGDKVYTQKVIEYGTELFGDKFNAVIDFLPSAKYLNLLTKIDIAIFNHNRQQALGNIITLLGLGKKVYIRKEITTWQFCIDHDLKVYSANDELDELFVDMPIAVKKNNIERIKTQFSEEKLVNDWDAIFRGDAQ